MPLSGLLCGRAGQEPASRGNNVFTADPTVLGYVLDTTEGHLSGPGPLKHSVANTSYESWPNPPMIQGHWGQRT